MLEDTAARPAPDGNRYGLAEWAGAFGDLGTLIPFVIAYLAVVRMDPLGVLLAFGLAMIATGLWYRTPVPVQPMKAIGAAAAQAGAVTPQAIAVAGLATGIFWIVLSATGLAQKAARLVPRPVAVGIVLGLGFGFMLEGLRMMATEWAVAAPGLLLTLLLLSRRGVPAMFALLAFGAAVSVARDPALVAELANIDAQLRTPSFALAGIAPSDLLVGIAVLAIPQLPLTFGNAVLALKEEHNRLFPERPVDERKVGLSTGLMNAVGAAIGGVPMCHGAGGLAAHVRFGARTGGAVVIMGLLLCATGLLFSGSIVTLLKVFPVAVLGVVLFLTGAQLALGSCEFSRDKRERFATLVTAGCSAWNVGIGFAIGWALLALLRRGWVKL